MAEYIKKEDIEQKIQDGLNNLVLGHDAIEVLGMIYEMPTADVAPVRHGYWRPILHKDGKTDYECSCCLGIIMDVPDDDEHDLCAWCSMCGAKMDGGFDNG